MKYIKNPVSLRDTYASNARVILNHVQIFYKIVTTDIEFLSAMKTYEIVEYTYVYVK